MHAARAWAIAGAIVNQGLSHCESLRLPLKNIDGTMSKVTRKKAMSRVSIYRHWGDKGFAWSLVMGTKPQRSHSWWLRLHYFYFLPSNFGKKKGQHGFGGEIVNPEVFIENMMYGGMAHTGWAYLTHWLVLERFLPGATFGSFTGLFFSPSVLWIHLRWQLIWCVGWVFFVW